MPTYTNLAATLAELKRLDEALAIVQVGLKINPSDDTLRNTLATLQQMQKQANSKPAPKTAR